MKLKRINRRISRRGVRLIASFEGLRLRAYQDTAGVWTIGYGHTHGVRPGQVITAKRAEEFLRADLAWAEDAVRALRIPLTRGQFDALVSLAFNCGPGILGPDRTIGQHLRQGRLRAVASDFGLYVHDIQGHRLEGLVRRRTAERARFES